MPVNITSPNSAQFVVEFTDSSGNAVTASSGTVTLVYTINGVANSSTIGLARSGSFWTATWSSVGIDVPSDVAWSVNSDVTNNPAQTGTIRIIDP